MTQEPNPLDVDGAAELVSDEGTVDGVPVLSDDHALARPDGPGTALSPAATSAVQAAAAAATGFVAGAATLALVRRHAARKVARTRARQRRDGLPIVASRSFLVDVHLIAKPGE